MLAFGYIVISLGLLALSPLDTADSLDTKAGKSDRNMMLNAENANVPRSINVGFGQSSSGGIVIIEGLRESLGLLRNYYHWAGGNSYEPLSSLSLIESLIYTGEIAIVSESRAKLGNNEPSGAFTGGFSSNGLLKFDGMVSGPLNKKNWFFSTGAYLFYDPTNVNAPFRRFVDQKQIFQFNVSKRWKRSSMDILSRFSLSGDNEDRGYSQAPFVYKGNGSIAPYNGFKIGYDCYLPSDDKIIYRDVVSGDMKRGQLGDMDRRRILDFYLRYNRKDLGAWNLNTCYHLCYMPESTAALLGLSSIVDAGGAFTTSGGEEFRGPVQNRQGSAISMRTFDNELRCELERAFPSHELKSGIDLMYGKQYYAASTFLFAHAVEASPRRLLKDGESCWNFNANAQYLDAVRLNATLYALDMWQASNDIRLRTGLRLRPIMNSMDCAPYDKETGFNRRSGGQFYLGADNCRIETRRLTGCDFAFTEEFTWHVAGRLFFNAEGFYSMTNKNTTYFKGANIPSVKPIGNAYARAGLSYDNAWMDITWLFSYITNWNAAQLLDVTNSSTGESIPWTAQYGIRTPGMTLDGNLYSGGFKLHFRATYQDPRYKKYRNEFVFSDGIKVIDYTGKFATGISQFLAELDPSFSWRSYRVWASIRYNSRQYASRNNLASFDGHFETFAGTDVSFRKGHSISLSLVNLLAQNGAKGSVSIIDTVEDQSILNNYLISGTYIRPFTAELSYTYKF